MSRVTGSTVGSMSVEFSGQSRKSGWALLPEPHLGHQVDGLGEVVVGHRPGPAHRLDAPAGNVALDDADVDLPGRRLRGLDLVEPQAGGTAQQATRAAPAARSTRRPRGPARRRPARPQGMAHQASSWATSATAKDSPATPTTGRRPASGVSTAAYASRLQPKPPNGTREYANSTSTQAAAAASGHQRSRPTRLSRTPEQAEEQRLEHDQQGGDPDPEHVQPADRDGQHAQPEQVAEPERPARRQAADRQGEGRDPTASSGHQPYGCQVRPRATPASTATAARRPERRHGGPAAARSEPTQPPRHSDAG